MQRASALPNKTHPNMAHAPFPHHMIPSTPRSLGTLTPVAGTETPSSSHAPPTTPFYVPDMREGCAFKGVHHHPPTWKREARAVPGAFVGEGAALCGISRGRAIEKWLVLGVSDVDWTTPSSYRCVKDAHSKGTSPRSDME